MRCFSRHVALVTKPSKGASTGLAVLPTASTAANLQAAHAKTRAQEFVPSSFTDGATTMAGLLTPLMPKPLRAMMLRFGPSTTSAVHRNDRLSSSITTTASRSWAHVTASATTRSMSRSEAATRARRAVDLGPDLDPISLGHGGFRPPLLAPRRVHGAHREALPFEHAATAWTRRGAAWWLGGSCLAASVLWVYAADASEPVRQPHSWTNGCLWTEFDAAVSGLRFT